MVSETLCAMEADAMRGHEVEFFAEIGQGTCGSMCERMRRTHSSAVPAKERRLVKSVQAQALVTQRLADLQKVTRAAAEIAGIFEKVAPRK